MNIFELAQSFSKVAKHDSGSLRRNKILADNDRLVQEIRNTGSELAQANKAKSLLETEISDLESRHSDARSKLDRNYEILRTMDQIGTDQATTHGKDKDVAYIKYKKPWQVERSDDGKYNLIPKHLRGRKRKEDKSSLHSSSPTDKADELDVLDFLS